MRKLRSFSLGSKFTPRRLNVAAVRGVIGHHIHQTLNQPVHVIGLQKLFFPKLFKLNSGLYSSYETEYFYFGGLAYISVQCQRGFTCVGNAALEKHVLSKFLFIFFKKGVHLRSVSPEPGGGGK